MRAWLISAFLASLVFAAGCGGDGDDRGQEFLTNPTSAVAAAVASPAPGATPPLLTLADIFPPRDLSSLDLDPSRLRTVIATGDVIPARYTDVTIRAHNDDFLYTVAATKEITSDADLTIINLEAPLMAACPYHDEGFTFCGRPGFVAALQAAGVDLATLENNHIGNYGEPGIEETVRQLEAGGIHWADHQTPAVFDVRGLKFGFLAFNGVGATIDRQAMVDQIRALRPQVDVLVVSFHWGAEYVSLPQTAPGIADDNPVEIAHLAVDAGADLIIGNHPHWVQAVELYKGKHALSGAEGYIAYAHGNFIFDQMWSYETRVGVIGRYTFYDDRLVRVEYIPTLIQDYTQPVLLQGQEAQAVLDGMKAASEQLAAMLAASPAP